MDQEQYFDLLPLVSPLIRSQYTCMRAANTPHEHLTITLRFLATGRSFKELKYTIISPQALVPSTERKWKNIAKNLRTNGTFHITLEQ
ncbi:hypothetical protein PR048_026476 [Dryococelus australis]|uniref:Uncharacterized protein n=1 Tax=Dryococelus australis TaxID=614101 RepID=A0ABQ9GLG6_9NEOP|nr:hypothetical protein PR048_026476 [Dryococelus australis]